jgi:hypothetical protein
MRHILFAAVVPAFLPAFASGQIAIRPPFDAAYSHVVIGSPAGVPSRLGGVAFKVTEPNVLYIGGGANAAGGAIYKIGVVRDVNRHITGFTGTATMVAAADYIDGGLEFHASGVLFYTRYPTNELGQIKPNSSVTDKVIALSPLGVASSVGSLTFVPAGYPQVGALKLVSYNNWSVHTATLTPDANGTFDLTVSTVTTSVQGGPEGCFYPPPDSPLIPNFSSMVFAEYGAGQVAVYRIDANGNPLVASRQAFMTGLSGAEGAAIDPLTGDFLFSTFGSGDQVIAVRGFGTPCGTVVHYGQGLAGTGNIVPVIDSVGCFARNQQVAFQVTRGRGGAPGVLVAGIQQAALPIFGGTLLVNPFLMLTHNLSGQSGQAGVGTFQLPMPVPNDTNLLNTDFFFQSVYVDTGAAQSFSFTDGIKLNVR